MKYTYIIGILLITLLVIPASADWLDGWDYRKSHNITGNSTWGVNQTYYQMKYNIYRSSGTDLGNSIYVESNCQADYDDIRFTTSDGTTLCDYWIESSSTALATVWVEIPSISTSTTTIYIYYGNSSATAVSSGLNTFKLFDTFDEGSLNTTKWAFYERVDVYSGYAVVGAGGDTESSLSSNYEYGINTSLHFTATISSYQNADGGYYEYYNYYRFFTDPDFLELEVYNSLDGNVVTYFCDYPEDLCLNYIIELTSNSSNLYLTGYVNNSLVTHTMVSKIDDYPIYFSNTGGAPKTSYVYLYDVYVCNRTENEPIDSEWYDVETYYLSANFSASDTIIDPNSTVNFTDVSDGYITNWSWDLDGDGSFDNTTERNVSYYYTTPGVYNVSLYVNSTYNSDWENKTFYIYVGQPPTADFSASPTSGEIGTTVTFTDLSYVGTATGWNWTFGDGDYSELQNPSHTYNTVGNYTVQLNASNAYGFDWENKTEYIQIITNGTSEGYGTQYPPLSVRWIVKDYYGNPVVGTNINATPTGFTSMGSWDWLKYIYGVNKNANLRYYSLNGVTGSDGTVSMLMLDTVEYEVVFTNTTSGISQTFTMYPKGPDEYIYLTTNRPNQTTIADTISHNLTSELNSNNTYTITLYYNDTTTNTQSLDFFVRNTNGTDLYTETVILPTNETITCLIPYHEGQSFEYGFNATTNSFGEIDYVRSDVYYPEKVDIGVSDTWLQWISVSIIIIFGAIFSRGNTSFGVIIVPVIAGLLIYMGWLSLSMMSSIMILLILGILIYIKERYRRDG